MVIGKPLPFVRAFVEAVDTAIAAHSPGQRLSTRQRAWLAFCMTAILVTTSICWARFERARLGTYSLAALSWMFRHAKIPWEHLLVASVGVYKREQYVADYVTTHPGTPRRVASVVEKRSRSWWAVLVCTSVPTTRNALSSR